MGTMSFVMIAGGDASAYAACVAPVRHWVGSAFLRLRVVGDVAHVEVCGNQQCLCLSMMLPRLRRQASKRAGRPGGTMIKTHPMREESIKLGAAISFALVAATACESRPKTTETTTQAATPAPA